MLCQVCLYANRAHAGATTAVRNAKGFVQVQVADVAANIAWAGQANHGIHVGPINIDLPTVIMRNLTNLLNGRLENTVG